MQCLCFVIVSTPLCAGYKSHSPLPYPTGLRHLVSEKAVSLTVCYALELIPRDALVLERRGLGNLSPGSVVRHLRGHSHYHNWDHPHS